MLRTPGQPIDLSQIEQPEFQQLIDQMVLTMRKAEGVGLAAPQIGQSIRLAVIDKAVDPKLTEDVVLINPAWQAKGAQQERGEEGCLSIPKVFGEKMRFTAVTVTAFDRFGKKFTLTAEHLFARVIQHEVDHLNGVLFIDQVERITRGQELLPS